MKELEYLVKFLITKDDKTHTHVLTVRDADKNEGRRILGEEIDNILISYDLEESVMEKTKNSILSAINNLGW